MFSLCPNRRVVPMFADWWMLRGWGCCGAVDAAG